MIPFHQVDITEADIAAMNQVLRSGWVVAGAETEAFEREFSAYISPPGESYRCIFTASCTAALKMAYKVLLDVGFEAISYPQNTFCATYSAAVEVGLDAWVRSAHNEGKGNLCLISSIHAPSANRSSRTTALTDEYIALANALLSTTGVSQPIRTPEGILEIPTTLGLLGSYRLEKDLEASGTTPPTLGYAKTGKQEPNANFVEAPSTSSGQTTTISTDGKEPNGGDCAESAILPTTLARVNVHYGSCKDETPCLIEDSAHRIEPEDPLVGKIRCYSFYATKNMTTIRGGMLVTNDTEIYERCRLYWRDGLSTTTEQRLRGALDYTVEVAAGGYDNDDVYAAMGRSQLRRLPDNTARRNQIRQRYNTAFGREWLGNHLYCLDLGTPKTVAKCRAYLRDRSIGSGYHYPGTGWGSVSLPLYPGLTDNQVEEIITAVKEGGYA